MEIFQKYLIVVVVGICLCVGYSIKHVAGKKKITKWIPGIVAVLGVFLNIWVSGWKISPDIVLGGMISGLASTGMHEMLRNFIRREEKEAAVETEEEMK